MFLTDWATMRTVAEMILSEAERLPEGALISAKDFCILETGLQLIRRLSVSKNATN